MTPRRVKLYDDGEHGEGHFESTVGDHVLLTVEEYRERALAMYTEGWSDGARKERGIPRDFSDDWYTSNTKRRLDEEVGNE